MGVVAKVPLDKNHCSTKEEEKRLGVGGGQLAKSAGEKTQANGLA